MNIQDHKSLKMHYKPAQVPKAIKILQAQFFQVRLYKYMITMAHLSLLLRPTVHHRYYGAPGY